MLKNGSGQRYLIMVDLFYEFNDQPASEDYATPAKVIYCDCERGHNGLGMVGRICDCDCEETWCFWPDCHFAIYYIPRSRPR